MTHVSPEGTPSWWRRAAAAVRFIITREPVAVQAVVRATIALVVAAGVALPEWVEPRALAVTGAFYLLVEVVTTLLARRKVTPVAKGD